MQVSRFGDTYRASEMHNSSKVSKLRKFHWLKASGFMGFKVSGFIGCKVSGFLGV